MKKLILIVSLFISILNADYAEDANKVNKAFENISLLQILPSLTNEAAKSLPIRLDAVTRLTRIYALGDTLTYGKEIDVNHIAIKDMWSNSTIRKDIISRMTETDTKTICNELIMGNLIRTKNMSVIYMYDSKDRKFLFSHTVTREICKNLNN